MMPRFWMHFQDIKEVDEFLQTGGQSGSFSRWEAIPEHFAITESIRRTQEDLPLLSTEMGIEINQHGWLVNSDGPTYLPGEIHQARLKERQK